MNSAPTLTFAVAVSLMSVPGTYCPSSSQSMQHATSEAENEQCYYDPSEAPKHMPCNEGYYREFLLNNDSRCKLCPENTFQPEKNNCPRCIQCKDCSKDGMLVKSPCTKTENTVCMDLPSIDVNFTTPKDDIESRSPSPLFTHQSNSTSTTYMNRSDSNENQPTHGPDVQQGQKHMTAWICLTVVTLLVIITSVIYICYIKQTKGSKIKQMEKELVELKACIEQPKRAEQGDDIDGQNRYEAHPQNHEEPQEGHELLQLDNEARCNNWSNAPARRLHKAETTV